MQCSPFPQDYTKGAVKRTSFVWSQASRTLSWTTQGTLQGEAVTGSELVRICMTRTQAHHHFTQRLSRLKIPVCVRVRVCACVYMCVCR